MKLIDYETFGLRLQIHNFCNILEWPEVQEKYYS